MSPGPTITARQRTRRARCEGLDFAASYAPHDRMPARPRQRFAMRGRESSQPPRPFRDGDRADRGLRAAASERLHNAADVATC